MKAQRKSLSRVDNVLGRVITGLGLDKRLHEKTLMDLWPTVVGDMLAMRSRCLFIDFEGKLVVAVKDAATGHELSMMKTQTLRKLQTAARGLNIQLTGIRFDLKHFHQPQTNLLETGSLSGSSLPTPTDEDLANIQLSEENREQLITFSQQLHENGNSNLPKRLIGLLEKQLRLKQWQRLNNYPLCTRCKETTPHLHGEALLCALCFFDVQTKSQSQSEQNFS